MGSDGPSALEDAWVRIPPTREATAGTGTFTRKRVERIISLVAGLGSLVLGVQAFVTALGDADERADWHLPLMSAVFVPLVLMIIACFVGRGVRVTAGLFAIMYVAVLAIWPIATVDSAPDPTDQPWIFYLINIATLAAVLAFPLPLQLVWTAAAPILFGVVRLIQGDFAQQFWFAVALDVSFTLILGGVILALGWVFRAVAANVDETRARAVSSYAQAAAADAAEQERMAVAALMHDSVLAALIAAERADTPRARTLAVAMARDALTRLANTDSDAEEGSDEPLELEHIARELESAADELGVALAVEREIDGGTPTVPGRVARALALAATQALANAVQHAGAAGLAARVAGSDGAVSIAVSDAGEGFELDEVPDDRLGIRASIMARVAAVGGTAEIDSGPHGTTVELDWHEGAA